MHQCHMRLVSHAACDCCCAQQSHVAKPLQWALSPLFCSPSMALRFCCIQQSFPAERLLQPSMSATLLPANHNNPVPCVQDLWSGPCCRVPRFLVDTAVVVPCRSDAMRTTYMGACRPLPGELPLLFLMPLSLLSLAQCGQGQICTC